MGFGMEPGAEFYEQSVNEEPPEPPKPSGGRPALKVVK